jgi:hypothetical protein
MGLIVTQHVSQSVAFFIDILSVIMFNDSMVSFIMIGVVMLSVIKRTVDMLSVIILGIIT